MNNQELINLIKNELPSLVPYIYEKANIIYIGFEDKNLYFCEIALPTNQAYISHLKILERSKFPMDSSYRFYSDSQHKDPLKFIMQKLKKYFKDIEYAINYFKAYDPADYKNKLEELGFESINPEDISFGYQVDNNTEFYIQIPSEGVCFDFALCVMQTGETKDYSFKSLEDVLDFLIKE